MRSTYQVAVMSLMKNKPKQERLKVKGEELFRERFEQSPTIVREMGSVSGESLPNREQQRSALSQDDTKDESKNSQIS